jgi:hypothetical protein
VLLRKAVLSHICSMAATAISPAELVARAVPDADNELSFRVSGGRFVRDWSPVRHPGRDHARGLGHREELFEVVASPRRLYIQQVLGYTPLEAGLAYLPLAAAVASATAVAQRLMPRVGQHVARRHTQAAGGPSARAH